MRRIATFALLTIVACNREQQSPDDRAGGSAQTASTATATSTAMVPTPAAPTGTYDQAMRWMSSTKGFTFTLTDGGTKATGELSRSTPGAEKVALTIAGSRWTAASGPNGVIWTRDGKPANPPADGNRMYQRLTLALDPQKVEGAAQLVMSDAATRHYRFTNAVTREVHNVWVDPKDNHVMRMTIESKDQPVELTVTGVKG
jgi:hypothetical protein